MSGRRTVFLMFALVMVSVSFFPVSAHAVSITLTDYQAVMASSIAPVSGIETISLLVDSALAGPGGIAAGRAAVGGASPVESVWLAEPLDNNEPPPDDGTAAIHQPGPPSPRALNSGASWNRFGWGCRNEKSDAVLTARGSILFSLRALRHCERTDRDGNYRFL